MLPLGVLYVDKSLYWSSKSDFELFGSSFLFLVLVFGFEVTHEGAGRELGAVPCKASSLLPSLPPYLLASLFWKCYPTFGYQGNSFSERSRSGQVLAEAQFLCLH